MAELSHLSYSSLSVYQSCARSWKFKYQDKAPSPPTPALAFGSAWHNTIESVIRSMALRESADLEHIWHEEFGKAIETVPTEKFDTGDTAESLRREGLALITSPDVIRAVGAIRPLMVDGQPVIEKKIELRVPGVPLPIVGYIDCLDENGVVIDFKTAERAWAPDRAGSEIQPLVYLAALAQEGFKLNPERRAVHIVFPKSGKVRVQQFEHTHTPAELFWLFGMIRECWRGIEAGVFVPNPGSWKCSPKYCDYFGMCRGKR